MTPTEEFEDLRSLLFAIAYRILGSVTDAEDAVQETWLRWETSATQPTSAKAFLTAIVARISIDMLRSARHRRETYIGPWLPEPVLTEPYEDPARASELADSLSMAALLLLERLSPLERAVFVLRDVFGFEFTEIASAVNRTEPACRQLVVRARRHMNDGRPRFHADRAERDALAEQFFTAFRDGDLGRLRQLLAADITMFGDAGGNAPAFADGVSGADKASRFLAALSPLLTKIGATVHPHDINGEPGAVMHDRDGKIINTFTLDILDGHIQTIRFMLSPDKLAHLGPVADPWAVARDITQARRSKHC